MKERKKEKDRKKRKKAQKERKTIYTLILILADIITGMIPLASPCKGETTARSLDDKYVYIAVGPALPTAKCRCHRRSLQPVSPLHASLMHVTTPYTRNGGRNRATGTAVA